MALEWNTPEGDLKRFCTRGLYLSGGTLVDDGPMKDVLAHYNKDVDAGIS